MFAVLFFNVIAPYLSILDPPYNLPIVHPEIYHQTLPTGATQPILITGTEEQTQQTDDFIVKLKGGRMDTTACFRELLAAFIAMQMEIPVVEPAVIHIDQDFADLTQGKDCHQRVQNSIGINVGSRYIEGFSQIPLEQPLNNQQLPYAKDIFCFDMLIENTDRTVAKQNMFSDGEQIVVYDHELAFGFLLMIGPPDPRPWEVTKAKWPKFEDLILPRKLNGKRLDGDIISEKIAKLDDDFWHRAYDLIPAEWQNDDNFDSIRDRVKAIQDHSNEFVKYLQNLLL